MRSPGKASFLLNLAMFALLPIGSAFHFGINVDIPAQLSRPKRSSVTSACLDTSEVSPYSLPNFDNVEAPWHQSGVHVYTSNTLLYNWNWMKTLPVRGLNVTVEDVIRFLDQNDCLYIAVGGAVRDALIGTDALDIDGEVSCSIEKVFRLCVEKYGRRFCGKAPVNEMSKMVVGFPALADTPYTSDPMDLSPWMSIFQGNSTLWDYTANTLALFDDQVGHVYLIDLTGRGKEDACMRRIVPTAPKDQLRKWINDDYDKLMRSYELRLNGFLFVDDNLEHEIAQEIRKLETREKLEDFYCRHVLDGVGDRLNGTLDCYIKQRAVGVKRRRAMFDNMYKADFGFDHFTELLVPIEEHIHIATLDQMPEDVVIDERVVVPPVTTTSWYGRVLEYAEPGSDKYYIQTDVKGFVETGRALASVPRVPVDDKDTTFVTQSEQEQTMEASSTAIGVVRRVGVLCVFSFLVLFE